MPVVTTIAITFSHYFKIANKEHFREKFVMSLSSTGSSGSGEPLKQSVRLTLSPSLVAAPHPDPRRLKQGCCTSVEGKPRQPWPVLGHVSILQISHAAWQHRGRAKGPVAAHS